MGITGGGAQRAEFWIFCSHLFVFQVTSSIISSLNAASVVYYRYQFVVSISHNFQNNYEIFMTKKSAHCAPVSGYNGPLGGTQQIYMETLLILLHLIFIYLILQINKDILSDLQQNSCFSCTVCATTVDSRGKTKSNAHHSFLQCHYHYCLELKMFFYFHFTAELLSGKNFSNMYYKISSGLFLWTVAKMHGCCLWLKYGRERGEQMSKSQFILVKYMYIP